MRVSKYHKYMREWYDLHRSGSRYIDIAEQYGVSRSTVGRYINIYKYLNEQDNEKEEYIMQPIDNINNIDNNDNAIEQIINRFNDTIERITKIFVEQISKHLSRIEELERQVEELKLSRTVDNDKLLKEASRSISEAERAAIELINSLR